MSKIANPKEVVVHRFISEDDIERALVPKFKEKWKGKYNFDPLNCMTSNQSELNERSNRTDKRDVKLAHRVYRAASDLAKSSLAAFGQVGDGEETGKSAHHTIPDTTLKCQNLAVYRFEKKRSLTAPDRIDFSLKSKPLMGWGFSSLPSSPSVKNKLVG